MSLVELDVLVENEVELVGVGMSVDVLSGEPIRGTF